jgi:molybdopterin-containing oxidoreductase family iron-sulfur binding subunit
MSKNNQQTYWRSLNELARNEEYKKFVEREFPENADELKEGYSRRNFLQIMGASIALAGFAACRKPIVKIVPFTNMPEYLVPGKPVYYATSMPFGGYVTGLVVETNSGRPTKIEGNELHPSSKGATNLFHQAATLGLYDPDRSRGVRNNGQASDWNSFVEALNNTLSDTSKIAFISESNSSLTVNRLRREALSRFRNSTWVTYDTFGEENQLLGSKLAFGRKLRVAPNLQNAKVIISLDADFMGIGADNTRNIRSFADGRKINSTEDSINRLYVVEANMSLTGSNADHRLRLKPSQIKPFLVALASSLATDYPELRAFSGATNDFSQYSWVSVLGEELKNNSGSSLLMAGADHDAQTHAMVAAINTALGNAGNTVDYLELPHTDEDDQHAKFLSVVNGMSNGEFDAVVMLGTNPVYTAPSGLDFARALQTVPFSVHLADYVDETSSMVTWHINRAHFLEYWADGYDYMGTPSVIQPMIQPLFGGKSEIEVLGAIVSGNTVNGADAVKDTWRPILGNGFEARWATVLHDGLHTELSFRNAVPSIVPAFSAAVPEIVRSANSAASGSLELNIKPDATLYDGRFANNGWLMELPDPITKITWDNVALVSPTTAEKLGISKRKFGDTRTSVIRLQIDGISVEMPAWVMPGHADDVVTVNTGYGRKGIGRVANDVGINVYPLMTPTERLYRSNLSVSLTGTRYDIASVQDHHSMEGRPIIREASIEEYRQDPRFAADMVYVPGKKGDNEFAVTLFTPQSYPEHEPQWGMTIDLTSCIGCGVCTIACQAENNIPVIGKEEVRRGREMHWMRNDRYFSGDEYGDVKVLHQPVTCVHCELAPCEQVCPVAATTHSDDGINQMTYNRCIGTRYCANNCPFKVRRFNFFNYPVEYLTSGDDPEVIQMAMNPDVSIRFRGIMEKCTYCVQRISRAKIATKLETGNSIKPADGTVKTACQQACPANAISFGDLTDKNSVVSKAKQNERNYVVLEELNIRPRTTYLAKIRNTNETLA